MKIWLARKGRGLVPADAESEKFVRKLDPGECGVFEAVKPRSSQWHRMYFGICRAIGENQDPERDENSIDAELRVRAGHFDVYLVEGHEVRVPKRIAFAELSADEWSALWPRLELAIVETFGHEYIHDTQWT